MITVSVNAMKDLKETNETKKNKTYTYFESA